MTGAQERSSESTGRGTTVNRKTIPSSHMAGALRRHNSDPYGSMPAICAARYTKPAGPGRSCRPPGRTVDPCSTFLPELFIRTVPNARRRPTCAGWLVRRRSWEHLLQCFSFSTERPPIAPIRRMFGGRFTGGPGNPFGGRFRGRPARHHRSRDTARRGFQWPFFAIIP